MIRKYLKKKRKKCDHESSPCGVESKIYRWLPPNLIKKKQNKIIRRINIPTHYLKSIINHNPQSKTTWISRWHFPSTKSTQAMWWENSLSYTHTQTELWWHFTFICICTKFQLIFGKMNATKLRKSILKIKIFVKVYSFIQ